MAYNNIFVLRRAQLFCCAVKFLQNRATLLQGKKLKSTEAPVLTADDCIDNFTNQLVEEKAIKWDNIKNKNKNFNTDNNKSKIAFNSTTYIEKINAIRNQSICIDIRNLSTDQIDNLLSSSLDADNYNDVSLIIEQCIKYQITPSIDIFFEVISFFSQDGQKDMVLQLGNLCESTNKNLFQSNAEMKHYIAEATWIKGNIEEATKMFNDIYRIYPNLRRKIRDMILQMITDTVANRSEASLVLVTNFAKSIGLEFNDYYPLICVWEYCFVSDWYSDQQLAVELFKNSDRLKKAVANRVFTIVLNELKYHHVETVHRLLELLLSEHMRSQYIQVLHVLFDYKCWMRDLQGCSEIIQSALDHQIPLSAAQHLKFIQLLTGQSLTLKTQKVIPKPPQFQMKF